MAKASKLKPVLHYDERADVLYVSLNRSDEPAYAQETDDILLVERGMFTNQILGFRFLDLSEHKIEKVVVAFENVLMRLFKEERLAVKREQREIASLESVLGPSQLRKKLESLVA